MNPLSIALVFGGAGAGGVTRYLLNLGLNPLLADMPLGTLTANVLGCGAAGAPPRTGVPDRPGAGVPVAPIEGNVPCWTVEDWTGCNCWGALTTLSPAVLERVVGEQAASSSAAAATPKTEPAPRIQSFMSDSCPRA